MNVVVWNIYHRDIDSGSVGDGDGNTIKRAKVNKSWINHKATTELSRCD